MRWTESGQEASFFSNCLQPLLPIVADLIAVLVRIASRGSAVLLLATWVGGRQNGRRCGTISSRGN